MPYYRETCFQRPEKCLYFVKCPSLSKKLWEKMVDGFIFSSAHFVAVVNDKSRSSIGGNNVPFK